ncbi:sushi, nidogen and EGF-like domain-containing protein 1 isoform X2 [Engraulis encrasicolus]|uniref:sushi, nidogen and EGF-like domain-containing protein 1 isoform X2 n=1 Tax=Engraulis encrasicolus TaxID=184585 RepID=UPI002FD5BE22
MGQRGGWLGPGGGGGGGGGGCLRTSSSLWRWYWSGLHVWLVVLTMLSLLPGPCVVEAAVPLEDFYPYGDEQGDAKTVAQDDGGSGLQEISVAFPFFGDRHTGLYVNNNGLVSFLREVSQFTPVAFPIAGDRRVVAPFWADVDNRRAGTVFYRESQEPAVLRRATADIRGYFPEFPEFESTWTLVATWHQVTFFGGSAVTPVNTFQVVLITDGELSFTIFQYHNVTWTTGMHATSGGDAHGLGGIAAQAGFNAGDGKRYFNIPGSRTDDVVGVEETTNVGMPGRWVFRIDDAHVQVGSCNDSASVCPHLRPCVNGGRCIDDCIKGNPSFTCSCLAGFTGRHCQIDIDECESGPCVNGAECVQGVNSFTCVCPPGYTGTLCQTDVDECASMPCLNGAECLDLFNNYTCACSPEYTGTHCETELVVPTNATVEDFNQTEVCQCQNGGVCVDMNGTCQCPTGYTGVLCEFEVTKTPCNNNSPCPHGGPCLEYGGTYLCTCQTGAADLDHKDFYHYVQPQSACDSAPCQNGGYCDEQDGEYTCECKHGYSGKHCEKVRQSVCASSPCRNGGSCKEEGGSYRCVCPYRFTGKHCEVGKPDPCSSGPCLNGGTCFHYIGKYKCECTSAYSGRHCEISRSSGVAHTPDGVDCGPPPQVKHASVKYSSTAAGAVAVYVCVSGYTLLPHNTHTVCGTHGAWSQKPTCEEVNECVSAPCLNGGTCLDRVSSFLCQCQTGFTGARCQTDMDECLSEPCKHGGTCEDRPGSYLCHCPQGYTGQHCEIEQEGCLPNPCLNGGVCRVYRRMQRCVCKDGFFGERCQSLENPCVLQPCGNRGFCRSDRRGNYSCTCKVGHTGRDCQRDLLPPSGLRVLRVEEDEVALRWDQLDDDSDDLDDDEDDGRLSGFAVTYAPLGRGPKRSDFLERQYSSYLLQGLEPGLLYNISTYSVRRGFNSNDHSQPAYALIRTRPRKVEQLEVTNVSSSQVWLRWLLRAAHHASVSQVRLSLSPADGSAARTATLNASVTDYVFSSLLPGQMYTVDVVTQSGLRPEDMPSTSHSAGPLTVWTRPLPPQNLSLGHVTSTTAHVTWERHPRSVPDGFVVNITRGLNTRSRYLPDGRLGSYTLRELSPGQHYQLLLTAVRNTGQEQVHSVPQHLAFTTLPMDERWLRSRERLSESSRGRPNGRHKQEVAVAEDREHSEEQPRFTELIDGRGRITAKFTNLPRNTIRHRPRPEPPVKLERMEETTNKISLALETTEEAGTAQRKTDAPRDCRSSGLACQNGGTCSRGEDGYICDCAAGFKGRQCELLCQRVPHPCTRLYSETKSVPVWEDGVCHYLYKRTYKVQQDVCYREICEPHLPKKTNRRIQRQQ